MSSRSRRSEAVGSSQRTRQVFARLVVPRCSSTAPADVPVSLQPAAEIKSLLQARDNRPVRPDHPTAARRIRAKIDIPVIYVTAYADRDLLERARDTRPAEPMSFE